MRVLVDSSVWIEFFRPRPSLALGALESLIQERQVVTCLPIKTEVLSGRITGATRTLVQQAFDAMDFVDLDWNSKATWDELIHISLKAQKKRVSIPGIVDRMLLACCLKSNLSLWTLDRKLQKLAMALLNPLFQSS